jgi:hypothetical protein
VLSELGRGAFGRVYLAEQADLANRKVAIKISSRLIGEAQTLARLQHTHIVPVYSIHRVGAFQLLVMPYLGGATLADVLKSMRVGASGKPTERDLLTAVTFTPAASAARQAIPPAASVGEQGGAASTARKPIQTAVAPVLIDRVLEIGIALADGLAHAHERGILHRDIKPANILLTDDGRPMLLDFNLAADDMGMSQSVGGTPRYMSPEQIESLDSSTVRIDHRADIYSLGLVLHELLTGSLPFPERAGSWEEIGPAMLADRRQAPVIRHESPAVAAILGKCLQPDPADRYASAAQLHDDLSRHRANQALKFADEPMSQERMRKWARRHPRICSGGTVATAAALLVAMIVFAGVTVWRNNQEYRAREARSGVAQARLQAQALIGDPLGSIEPSREARQRVLEALSPYDLPGNADWLHGTNVRRLPADETDPLRTEVAELLYWGAEATARLADREPDAAARATLMDEALLWNARAAAAYPANEPFRPIVAQRVWLLDRAGRNAEADTAREELARSGIPGDGGQLFQAMADLRERRYREAANILDELTRREASYSAWMALGATRLRLHQYESAADAYLAASAIEPSATWPLLYRGVSLLSAGRFAAAVQSLDRFIEKRPGNPDGWWNRALARMQLNELDAALTDLAEAERHGASAARVHGLRERLWRARGDAKQAAAEHRKLLAVEPDDADGWTIRGEARLASDPTAALADFDAALALEADHVPALRGKASCLSEKLNRPRDAAAVLDRIVELGASTVEDRAGHAVLLARVGRTDDARKQARTCLDRDTGALPLYQAASALALTATTADDRAEVIGILRRVIQRDAGWAKHMPGDPDLRNVSQERDFKALMDAARVVAGPMNK